MVTVATLVNKPSELGFWPSFIPPASVLPLLLAAAIVMNLNDWRLAFWCIFTATTGVRVAGGGGDASTQIIHVDEFLKATMSTTSTNRPITHGVSSASNFYLQLA